MSELGPSKTVTKHDVLIKSKSFDDIQKVSTNEPGGTGVRTISSRHNSLNGSITYTWTAMSSRKKNENVDLCTKDNNDDNEVLNDFDAIDSELKRRFSLDGNEEMLDKRKGRRNSRSQNEIDPDHELESLDGEDDDDDEGNEDVLINPSFQKSTQSPNPLGILESFTKLRPFRNFRSMNVFPKKSVSDPNLTKKTEFQLELDEDTIDKSDASDNDIKQKLLQTKQKKKENFFLRSNSLKKNEGTDSPPLSLPLSVSSNNSSEIAVRKLFDFSGETAEAVGTTLSTSNVFASDRKKSKNKGDLNDSNDNNNNDNNNDDDDDDDDNNDNDYYGRKGGKKQRCSGSMKVETMKKRSSDHFIDIENEEISEIFENYDENNDENNDDNNNYENDSLLGSDTNTIENNDALCDTDDNKKNICNIERSINSVNSLMRLNDDNNNNDNIINNDNNSNNDNDNENDYDNINNKNDNYDNNDHYNNDDNDENGENDMKYDDNDNDNNDNSNANINIRNKYKKLAKSPRTNRTSSQENIIDLPLRFTKNIDSTCPPHPVIANSTPRVLIKSRSASYSKHGDGTFVPQINNRKLMLRLFMTLARNHLCLEPLRLYLLGV